MTSTAGVLIVLIACLSMVAMLALVVWMGKNK